jgi:hypothetical protein
MKINWSQVWEGWRNKLLPPERLKQLIKITAEERMKICNTCEWNSSVREGYKSLRPDVHCVDCGCTLSAKTKCLSCKCLLNPSKWEAVISEEQEEILYEDETFKQQSEDKESPS